MGLPMGSTGPATVGARGGRRPNVLITGTPGTGKTSTSQLLAEATGLRHVNVGDLVRQKELHDGWDDEYDCFVLDEDKVVDELEESMSAGGVVVEHHSCDFFPERWFDLVVVLQTDNSVLYDRLHARGYTGKKLQSNMECEIMQVLLEEARDSYKESIVHPMQSDSLQDMERNVATIKQMVAQLEEGGFSTIPLLVHFLPVRTRAMPAAPPQSCALLPPLLAVGALTSLALALAALHFSLRRLLPPLRALKRAAALCLLYTLMLTLLSLPAPFAPAFSPCASPRADNNAA
ncbi:unnamed protein product [Closterium sp. Naga37s-1]|nr:unnamed protein product [Closterium sp. Naga37s-1]